MYFEKVKQLIVEEMNVDTSKITMETNFVDDLGADSLDAVELVFKIQEEFNVVLTEEESTNFATVGDVVKLLEAKLK